MFCDTTNGAGLRPPKELLTPRSGSPRTPPPSAATPKLSPLSTRKSAEGQMKRSLPRVDLASHEAFECGSGTSNSANKRRSTAPSGLRCAHDTSDARNSASRTSSTSLPACLRASERTRGLYVTSVDASYITLDLLGEGTFGTTFRHLDASSGSQAVVKRLHRLRAHDDMTVRVLVAHLDALRTLPRHEHIAAFLGARLDSEGVLCVYQEACSGRTLARVLAEHGPIPVQLARKFTRDIVRGLTFLHAACNMPHGDLRGRNVFVEADGSCRLADFQLQPLLLRAHVPQNPAFVPHGAKWRAPELIQAEHGDPVDEERLDLFAADVWSVGALLVETLTGKAPDAHMLLTAATEHDWPSMPGRESARAQVLGAVRGSEEAAVFVARCCAADPAARPHAAALDMNKFLQM